MNEFSIPAEFDFGQQFELLTLQRAMALEPERAVLSMHVDGLTLLTRLQGSGASLYDQRIELPVDRRLGLRVQGHCSCPVGFNCKHVAAALMAFEAHQIRLKKDPAGAALDPRMTVATKALAPGAFAAMPTLLNGVSASPTLLQGRAAAPEMPLPLVAWLAELAQLNPAPEAAASVPAEAASPKPPVKQLMYVLSALGTQLQLRIHLGSLRRTGEPGSHHAHSASVADMLRNPPSYLVDADLVVLAALLPLALQAITSHIVLSGRYAPGALRALMGSGRVWLLKRSGDVLPLPPGPPARWLDEPLQVALQWQADTAGQWRTHWRSQQDDGPELVLVLLPEPHVLDVEAATLQPATLTDALLPGSVADWLSRMPSVPAQVLPQFIERLQRGTSAKHINVPLPQTLPQESGELGALKLVPVLRLSTCVDVSSEAMLHYRYGSAASRNTTLRQASAQVLFRYLPPGAGPVEFHVPVATAESAFVEVAHHHALARFQRDGAAESAALRELFGPMEFRPWSLAAGLVLNRLTRVNTGRLQDAAIPPASEGQPLLLVLRQREQWPDLLATTLPALQARGWVVEVEDDFPFELHNPDEWAVNIDEEPGAEPGHSDWFSVGLKVKVDGKPVDLVPLLVSLVQTGWLKLDAALREHGHAKREDADAADVDGDGEVERNGDSEPISAAQTDADRHVLVPSRLMNPPCPAALRGSACCACPCSASPR